MQGATIRVMGCKPELWKQRSGKCETMENGLFSKCRPPVCLNNELATPRPEFPPSF